MRVVIVGIIITTPYGSHSMKSSNKNIYPTVIKYMFFNKNRKILINKIIFVKKIKKLKKM